MSSVRAAWYEDDGAGCPGARIGDEFTLNDGDRLTAPNVGERVWLLTLAGGLLNAHPNEAGVATVWEVCDHRILSPGRPVWLMTETIHQSIIDPSPETDPRV